jgi:hypothetical protein
LAISGPKVEEITGGWKKLHNEEHRSLYTSANIVLIKSRRMRWSGHVARMNDMINGNRTLIKEGKTQHRRTKQRREIILKYGLGSLYAARCPYR